MLKRTWGALATRPELIILALIVIIIAMLIVPLPTVLVDLLIGVNIVISLLILLGSFYIERVLNFSSFPSLLLITTLFRLALSISTSRLILLDADAGHIVSTFGEYVIGDSLVVGFVVFAIVTVVQFIVITKGSERVAEVAARFSLDGMPGKQMSIDADLRAGILDAESAKERRATVEKESQLYGSFDGAMKFIKGDAIAGIVIIFVNFIGGITVGMVQRGTSFSDALSVYTKLTIGDGLVAQIPALLISIAAGFVVTRVNGESKNLGHSIVSQLFQNPFVILVTAILTLSMGMLPGFPLPVFIVLSGAMAFLYWRRTQAAQVQASSEGGAATFIDEHGNVETDQSTLDTGKMSAETVPLIFVVAERNKSYWVSKNILQNITNRFFLDYGIRLPQAVVSYSASADESKVGVFVNEVRAAEFDSPCGQFHIMDYRDELSQLDINVKLIQGVTRTSAWVSEADASQVEKMGYALRSDVDELYQNVAGLLARNVQEYFGIQEAKNLLDELEGKYPELLKETYRHASVQKISEVLQRLLLERISVRNMKLILESLAKWAPKEKDVITLVEHIRSSLGRYISDKFAAQGKIRAIVVSPGVEEMVRKGVRQTNAGVFLNLDPAEAEEIMDLFAVGLNGLSIAHKDMVLLASVDIRRFVKRLIESQYGELEVLSFGEISDSISIDVLRTI
ncbi:EscV/YscV/HrcV family type III secretion system export apparatus protein [Iodobacter sp. LRB]|uniref:EscV/YscV/HrcV family type III secretion system export apparatus protein n=1 Tax=unclassified Iodobacter TaxID=235634 RepID=UPI000C0C9176|nr:EscV/YscV/HrcV family type III secretion system export apparatus protein [Iodobacter sp. BJB302]PHU99651.1 EscV/YscV/HrcV family type III secretion system export apparatus protein [Iodobacter sp. BJB302]